MIIVSARPRGIRDAHGSGVTVWGLGGGGGQVIATLTPPKPDAHCTGHSSYLVTWSRGHPYTLEGMGTGCG